MTTPRWQAPSDSGAVLVVPSWDQLPALVESNQRLIAGSRLRLAGQSLSELRDQARHDSQMQMQAFARSHGLAPVLSPAGLLIASGHQPELYHPGVLAKNFAVCKLAQKLGGSSWNLTVDSDLVKSTRLSLPVPGGPADIDIAISPSPGLLPWEEWICEDEATFANVGRKCAPVTASWPWEPVLEEFWTDAVAAKQFSPLIPVRWVLARHAWEARAGLSNQELLMSSLCQAPFFGLLVGSFVERRAEFAVIYNNELTSYRTAHRIRSKNHPVANLLHSSDVVELPFWCWQTGERQRGRLFARESGKKLQLVCRTAESDRLIGDSWPTQAKNWEESWQSVGQSRWKIRPKALITSMIMRLFISDLFIHGIGGAVYDELTDRIFAKYYQTPLPEFAVVTATLRLPWKTLAASQTNDRDFAKALRELRWNPDRFLTAEARENFDVQHYLRLKRQLISAAANAVSGRDRFALFRDIHEGLQPYVQEQKEILETQLREVRQQRKRREHLLHREFPWIFYPDQDLRLLAKGFND